MAVQCDLEAIKMAAEAIETKHDARKFFLDMKKCFEQQGKTAVYGPDAERKVSYRDYIKEMCGPAWTDIKAGGSAAPPGSEKTFTMKQLETIVQPPDREPNKLDYWRHFCVVEGWNAWKDKHGGA